LGNFPTGNSWCDPFNTWQNVRLFRLLLHTFVSQHRLKKHTRSLHTAQAYTFNPVANLTTAQAKLVLGGQHLLWTEQSGPQNLDSIVWPRAAAAAEVFWTPTSHRDVGGALPRLHELAYRFRRRGVDAIALQPEWCALRPYACDLKA